MFNLDCMPKDDLDIVSGIVSRRTGWREYAGAVCQICHPQIYRYGLPGEWRNHSSNEIRGNLRFDL